MRIGELMVMIGDRRRPDVPGDDAREPAFGMKAMWISDASCDRGEARGLCAGRQPFRVLTHVSEVIRNNLSQLLSYKDTLMTPKSSISADNLGFASVLLYGATKR